MLVLGIDTSTTWVPVALVEVADGCTVRAASGGSAPNRHGELLAPTVTEVFAAADAHPADLAAVAVGLGPGPFTGLRVGIVTAAAMADALGVPAYGCCSLDAVPLDEADRDVVVLTDARRRQLYWARYVGGRRVDGPELDRPQELADRLRGDRPVLVGPGAGLYADDFRDFVVRSGRPEAAAVVEQVADRVRRRAPSEVLEPLYLRRPDARPPGAPKRVVPA